MGEIKSTLDLVMERTRHLSLTAEEKAQQRQEDFTRRLQGLLQQYADGALTIDRLQERITELQGECGVTAPRAVMEAVVARIDPDADNQSWLALLTALSPTLGETLDGLLDTYRRQHTALRETAERREREKLARQSGIHGSAVVANPAKDAEWRQRSEALRQSITSRIAAATG